MERLQFIGTKTLQILRSPRFFYAIIILLAIQSLWIALTARYPQAFDENYHIGLIHLHASQLLPWFTEQLPGASVYGAVVRDPSYLYHYLMSFPYTTLVELGLSKTVIIISLRILNIAMFIGGLFVFRRLLMELGVSTALRNTVLLIFVLLPVSPLLAAQVNYDNLLVILTPLLFLYTARWVKAMEANPDGKQKKLDIPVDLILKIGIVGSFASIVKFSFSPIFFATILFTLFVFIRAFRKYTYRRAALAFTYPRRYVTILLVGALLIGVALCFERYGINLIKYGHPVPKCDKVLSIEECKNYSPWARDHLFAQIYPRPTPLGIAVYPPVWAHRMVYETMFTIGSFIYNDKGQVQYVARPPLTIANWTAWTIVVSGAVLLIVYIRRIWANRPLRYLFLIAAFYTMVLFIQNYKSYLHTGEAVAIHGRYLVPFYPVLLVMLALAFKYFFEKVSAAKRAGRFKSIDLKPLFLILTMLFFLQGAGFIVWIVKSDGMWFWQHIPAAHEANRIAKEVVDIFVYTK